MADALLAYRDRFPTLRRGPYFAAHHWGRCRTAPRPPWPGSRPSGPHGVVAWCGWLEQLRATAGLLEGLFGAPAGSVALGPNVSVLAGQGAVVPRLVGRAQPAGHHRPRVPHLRVPVPGPGDARGQGRAVPTREDLSVDLDRLLEAIDTQTALVAVTHVAFRSSALLDAAAVAARAHEVGALVLLDTYQSAGTVPIDVAALDVDLMVGGSVKWLLGGPGTGYLYAKPEVAATLAPWLVGWFGHEDPFAFRPSPIAYAPGPAASSPAPPTSPPTSWRPRATSSSPRPGSRPSGQVPPPGGRPAGGPGPGGGRPRPGRPGPPGRQRGGRLRRRRAGHRRADRPRLHLRLPPGGGLRLGPHLYTTDDECDAVVAEVAALRAL